MLKLRCCCCCCCRCKHSGMDAASEDVDGVSSPPQIDRKLLAAGLRKKRHSFCASCLIIINNKSRGRQARIGRLCWSLNVSDAYMPHTPSRQTSQALYRQYTVLRILQATVVQAGTGESVFQNVFQDPWSCPCPWQQEHYQGSHSPPAGSGDLMWSSS